MSCLMRSATTGSVMGGPCGKKRGERSVLGQAGLECQRVELVTHASAQGLVDQLVLLHAGLALEGRGDDVGGVMIAIAPEVLNGDARVGQALLDEPLDGRRVDRQRVVLRIVPRSQGAAMYSGSQASCARLRSVVDMAPWPATVNASPPVVPSMAAGTPAALARARSPGASATARM